VVLAVSVTGFVANDVIVVRPVTVAKRVCWIVAVVRAVTGTLLVL
jgi:hypothetical protein